MPSAEKSLVSSVSLLSFGLCNPHKHHLHGLEGVADNGGVENQSFPGI